MTSAIIGFASRLPGARDLKQLWEILISGICTVSDLPTDRWSVPRFLHPNPGMPGFSYSFAGGYLDDPLDFDPLAFGISPREAAQIDPQQRLLLELVWEALEDAGIPPSKMAGEKVGVYVGASNVDYQSIASVDHAVMESHFITGIALAIASNRISYTFDLRGPSLTVDTACSSSIVALDKAVKAIESGEIDTAIVAGVNMLLSPIPFIGFSRARMLSPTGRSRPFSAEADGYVRAEGGVAFVLRRLKTATGAGDRIRSVVMATGVNSDGRTVGMSLPSVEGQSALLADVYQRAEIAPERLAFLEAHGTGTPVGDPIEAQAIGEMLGQRRQSPLVMGSIKSNIGHLESASGAAAMAKVILSLENGIYPRTVHLEELNPRIDFDALNLRPATKDLAFDYDADGSAIAGISNYGFGGTNAHAVLRAPTARERAVPEAGVVQPAQLLVLSAHTREALSALASSYRARLTEEGADIDLAARASAWQRDRLKHRAVVPLVSHEEAIATLGGIADGGAVAGAAIAAAGGRSSVAFVFSGNGAQWAGMGVNAYRLNQDFAAEMGDLDARFQAEAGWSLIEALHAPDLKDRLAETSVAQPLIYALQSALAAVLVKYGVKPDFVLGHSVGEIAAAEASGAVSRATAVRLVKERSFHQEKVRGAGGMMAVAADEAAVAALVATIGGALEIAAVNAPNSITVVGREDDLQALAREARRQRIATIRLDIDYPFHSSLLEDIREPLLESLRDIRGSDATVPFISSVTGARLEGSALDAQYWWRNIRSPVAFRAAVARAADAGATLFIEISPRPILVAAVAEIFRESGVQAAAIASLDDRKGNAEQDPVLALLATLVARGALEPSESLIGSEPPARLDLPHYPWQNQRCVLAKTSEGIEAFGRIDGGERHPLIGTRLAQGSPEWRMLLDAETMPYLADHQVAGEIVVPGAAFVEMSLAVGRAIHGDVPLELSEVDIARPLILTGGAMREVSTRYERSLARVEIWSRPRFGDDWTLNAGGRVSVLQGEGDAAGLKPDLAGATPHTHADVYAASTRAGLQYGPAFQRVADLRKSARWLDATLTPSALDLGAYADDLVLDPTGLDAAFHGVFVGLGQKAGETRAFLPVRIRRLRCWAIGASAARAVVETMRETAGSRTLRGALFDAQGGLVAEFDGVYLKAAVLGRTDDGNRVFQTRFALLQPANPSPILPPVVPQPAEPPPAWLLTRAVVIAAAHEALLGLSVDGQLDIGAGDFGDLVSDEGLLLLGVALRLLESAALASEQDGIWTIAQDDGFPPPAALIAALAARFPEAQAELLAANAVATRFADRLRNAGSGLSPELEQQFWASATILQDSAESILQWVDDAARQAARPLRVAILAPSARIIQDRLRPLAEAGRINLVLVKDGPSATTVPWLRAIDLASEASLAATPLATIDAIVGLPTGRLPDREKLAKLEPLLAPDCGLLIGALPHDDALDLVLGLTPDWLQQAGDAWLAFGAAASVDEIAAAARHIGFVVPEKGTVLVAGTRAAPVEQDTAPACRLIMPEPELQQDEALAGALTVQSGGGAVIHVDLPLLADGDSIAGQGRAMRIVERVRGLAAAGQLARLWIVTRDAFANGKTANPVADAIWSFARVAMNEYPVVDIRLVDVAGTLAPADAAGRLLAVFGRAGEERELLIGEDGIRAPRVAGAQPQLSTGLADKRTKLQAQSGAGFEQFGWQWADRRAPADGEIEIAVEATGLNFRDVMVGMGLLDEGLLAGGMSSAALGFECAGRVTRVGPHVEGLSVGDRVTGFAAETFASHVTSRAQSFAKVPEGLTSEAAATIPVAFSTAWFALRDVARLRAGETVLIHGAVGGVGQAAIQIARAVGAKIIATAGSVERRNLARAFGADAVYNSRGLEFAEQIRSEHGGVDVVLNSLSGEAMRVSFGLLRPFGRFIELGKRDFLENTALELRPFVRNLSYFGVDLDELLAHDAGVAQRVLRDILASVEKGELKPLPFRVFAGEDVADAMRLMQRSGHVGKIVVRPAERALDVPKALSFKPKAGPFVVLGGTGGFGLETAIWLADQGASPVIVASRRGHVDPAEAGRLDAYAGRIIAEQADATDPGSVRGLIERTRKAHGPIVGVVHTAMVLEDGFLEGLTVQSLAKVVLPKAVGLTALDEATRDDPLQCFVAYSSATTLIGNPGQGAYVLANAYLEGLMRQRRLAGRPALAVGWGAIAGVGVIARDAKLGERLQRTSGVAGVPFRDALDHLGRLLAQGDTVAPVQVYSAMGNSSVARSLTVLKAPAFAALVGPGGEQGEASSVDLRSQIAGKSDQDALAIVVAATKGEIGKILRIEADAIDAGRPLSEIGMDSLMALELRLGVEKRIGVDLPLMSLGDRTATHVAETILAGLQGAQESESEVFNLANAMTSIHGGGDTDVAETVVDLIERPAGVRGGVL